MINGECRVCPANSVGGDSGFSRVCPYAGRRVQPYGVWFGAGNVCVSGVVDALPKRYTNRICEGQEDLPSCKAILEAIKFEEKPSCVELDS